MLHHTCLCTELRLPASHLGLACLCISAMLLLDRAVGQLFSDLFSLQR